jgi:hypothetical protein
MIYVVCHFLVLSCFLLSRLAALASPKRLVGIAPKSARLSHSAIVFVRIYQLSLSGGLLAVRVSVMDLERHPMDSGPASVDLMTTTIAYCYNEEENCQYERK